jgi:hypothetical protein
MSPTKCGVSECDREAWTMRRPWPTRGCFAMEKHVALDHLQESPFFMPVTIPPLLHSPLLSDAGSACRLSYVHASVTNIHNYKPPAQRYVNKPLRN